MSSKTIAPVSSARELLARYAKGDREFHWGLLGHSDLNGVTLRNADLGGTDLRGADLRGADLRGADLRGADLRGAQLDGTDLRGARLPHWNGLDQRTSFGNACFSGTARLRGWPGWRSWAWLSSPLSAEAQIPTVLACVETLSACGLAVWFGLRWGSWNHLLLASFAPIVLLRSPGSTRTGLRWADALGRRIDEKIKRGDASRLVVLVTWLLAPPVIRFLATVVEAARSPSEVLALIQSNWARIALHTDMAHAPEILPGAELDRKTSTFSGTINVLKSLETPWKIIPFVAIEGAIFLPTVWLRWSLKSTSIIYAPLIYLSRFSYGSRSLRDHSEEIVSSKLALYYAIFWSLGCCSVVPIAVATWLNLYLARLDPGSWSGHLIDFFAITPTMRPWNVARLLGAVLTITMFVIAKSCMRSIVKDRTFDGSVVGRLADVVLRVLNIVRATTTLYVILCGILIFWTKILPHVAWPEIEWLWIPTATLN